jgi:uncharacterized coiled-coil protein SlyX
MPDDALERLETKLAFLERADAELSEELFRQRKEIEELRARLAALAGRLEAAATPAEDSDPLRERPPHY